MCPFKLFKKKTPFDILKKKISQTKKDIELDKNRAKKLKEAEWFNRSYFFIGTAPDDMITAHAKGEGHFNIYGLPQNEFFKWYADYSTCSNTFSNYLFDLIKRLGLTPRVIKTDKGLFIIQVVFVDGAYSAEGD